MEESPRHDRITNITGLRTQAPPAGHGRGEGAGGGVVAARGDRAAAAGTPWWSAACRLCGRPVGLFAQRCVCGMPDPARSGRRTSALLALLGVVAALGVAVTTWWRARG